MQIEELNNKLYGKSSNNEQKKFSQQMAQINSLNVQIDKYKNMYCEKKNELNNLLEKCNELQKIIDQNSVADKKLKNELLNKDKQIARLIEEIDKKSNYQLNKVVSNDKEVEKLTIELKKIEKQKNELYVAFKKL